MNERQIGALCLFLIGNFIYLKFDDNINYYYNYCITSLLSLLFLIVLSIHDPFKKRIINIILKIKKYF